MAKGRGGRGPSRMDLRRQAEAAEARGTDEEGDDTADEEVEDDADAESDSGDGDEEGAKKPKKKAKAAPKAKKAPTKRVRAQKEVRQKAVWVVFDNASKRVETFPFNQKAEAEALLAKKIQEKEGKATFYLNLVKEEIS